MADAEKLVRHYDGCQFFMKCIHVPAHEIQTILASWPFTCWGLDIIGPFKPAPRNFKCVFMMIDKFSKWIDQGIFRKSVRIPRPDLGTQFTSSAFWDFCDERSIVVKYVFVAHPRASG
jgi:hypothetical protein